MRVIDGQKIKECRGQRSLREIAKASGGQFTAIALWSWEQGKYAPTIHRVPHLLAALDCTYDEITRPYCVSDNRQKN